jgi:hypothetical protein
MSSFSFQGFRLKFNGLSHATGLFQFPFKVSLSPRLSGPSQSHANLVAVEIVSPSGDSKTRLVRALITALNIRRPRAALCKKAGCTSLPSVLALHIPNVTIRHSTTDEIAALDV